MDWLSLIISHGCCLSIGAIIGVLAMAALKVGGHDDQRNGRE